MIKSIALATLGVQCSERALGMATLGIFCGDLTKFALKHRGFIVNIGKMMR